MMLGIGDAANQLDTAPSTLRHWEEMGLIHPSRSAAGHRRYSPDDLDHGRLVQRCQAVGLSLDEIRRLIRSTRPSRLDLVAEHRSRLADKIGALRSAIEFLDHITNCTHPIIADCPDCRRFTA